MVDFRRFYTIFGYDRFQCTILSTTGMPEKPLLNNVRKHVKRRKYFHDHFTSMYILEYNLEYIFQNGDECHCGDDPLAYQNGPENRCNKRCYGDSEQICGGEWRLSMYNTSMLTVVNHKLKCWSTISM